MATEDTPNKDGGDFSRAKKRQRIFDPTDVQVLFETDKSLPMKIDGNKQVTPKGSDSLEDASAKRRGGRSRVIPDDIIKPFNIGWKRELVYRGAAEEGHSKGADVYYFTPAGKKLRSMPEITKFLSESKSELVITNFTFSKEPIYKEPFESVRSAKKFLGTSPLVGKVKEKPATLPPKRVQVSKPAEGTNSAEATATPPQRLPIKTASKAPDPGGDPTLQVISPAVKPVKAASPSRRVSPLAANSPIEKNTSRPRKSTPQRTYSKPKKIIGAGTGATQCSVHCPRQQGILPSLSCHKCCIMFHPACQGVSEFQASSGESFECHQCQQSSTSQDSVQPSTKTDTDTTSTKLDQMKISPNQHTPSPAPMQNGVVDNSDNSNSSENCEKKVISNSTQVPSSATEWEHVTVNYKVKDWELESKKLKEQGCASLQLARIPFPSWVKEKHYWESGFLPQLQTLDHLRVLRAKKLPLKVVHAVIEQLSNLEELSIEIIVNESPRLNVPLKFGQVSTLKQLTHLALGSLTALEPADPDINCLRYLEQLEHLTYLSLPTVVSAGINEWEWLGSMTNLTTLEIGQCTNWTADLYELVGKLEDLKRLQLSCGVVNQGLVNALWKLQGLMELELVLFELPDLSITEPLVALAENKLELLVVWPAWVNREVTNSVLFMSLYASPLPLSNFSGVY